MNKWGIPLAKMEEAVASGRRKANKKAARIICRAALGIVEAVNRLVTKRGYRIAVIVSDPVVVKIYPDLTVVLVGTINAERLLELGGLPRWVGAGSAGSIRDVAQLSRVNQGQGGAIQSGFDVTVRSTSKVGFNFD